ncbi:MAG: metallophosphoesterase family protein [Acidobacteria bacterium]|nr:metallophosphoesterase family protein [Acidobacteriota bacterium]MBI3279300.1 metallophosphoesterase family protein [Acidobacteriota bacterium]
MTVAGVISDTHGLLRPEAVAALAGVSLILHAGDVGAPEVLAELARVAPVFAVRGNVDTASWARALPLSRTVEVERARIYVLHNFADLAFDPAARGLAAVVSGHSHRPSQQVRDRVLFLNPGSAGRRRFRLPVTVARMTINGASVSAEMVTLAV